MRSRIISLVLVVLLLSPIVTAGSQFRTSLSQKAVSDFELTSHGGEEFKSSDIEADVVVLSFIFTTCPDVCPTLTQTVKTVQSELSAEESKRVEFISITVDPKHDTPEKLKAYSEHHGANWPHLTGSEEELKSLWQEIGMGVDSITPDDGMSDEHDGMKNHSMTHQIITVLPNESTYNSHVSSTDLPANQNAWNLTTTAYEKDNVSFNYVTESWGHMLKAVSGYQSPEDWSWWWELRAWNASVNSWESSQVGVDSLNLSDSQHIAWAPNNTAMDSTPLPECSGNGWEMGMGNMTHCMCDDGYSWDEDDKLSCVASEEVVIHTPYTFILDSELKPRIKYTGDQWKAEDMLEDISDLLDEEERSGLSGFTFSIFLSALIIAIAWRKD